MNAQPPQQHDDALALQEILSLVERSVAEYNTIVAEVRGHQERIAKARAALGPLRRRLVGMQKAVKGWDDRVWKMGYREVPRDVLLTAERQVRAQRDALDDLVWQLFDFRELDGGRQ